MREGGFCWAEIELRTFLQCMNENIIVKDLSCSADFL